MQPTGPTGLKPGDVIEGRYVLRDRIGQGGMGSVFLADQPAMGRTVAIKVLHAEVADGRSHARRVRDEAMTARRVRNPHCVAVIDRSTLPDGTPYLVMEHVPGRSLGRVIAEDAMPLARAVDLVDQLLIALAAIHEAGVIHGDVKSDNCLVASTGGRDHVTLVDFGLARVARLPARVELDGGEPIVLGTPEYMAPEVIGGDPPERASDLYAAGVILYELLTGAPPFAGGTATEIMLRHADDRVIPPSLRLPDRGIPAALDRVVLRALDKRPSARFPDAAAFARALRTAAGVSRALVGRTPCWDHTATAEAPTRNYRTPLPGRRFARGSDCSGQVRGADLVELRRAIGSSIR